MRQSSILSAMFTFQWPSQKLSLLRMFVKLAYCHPLCSNLSEPLITKTQETTTQAKAQKDSRTNTTVKIGPKVESTGTDTSVKTPITGRREAGCWRAVTWATHAHNCSGIHGDIIPSQHAQCGVGCFEVEDGFVVANSDVIWWTGVELVDFLVI